MRSKAAWPISRQSGATSERGEKNLEHQLAGCPLPGVARLDIPNHFSQGSPDQHWPPELAEIFLVRTDPRRLGAWSSASLEYLDHDQPRRTGALRGPDGPDYS